MAAVFPRLPGVYRPPKIQVLLTKCDLVKRLELARRITMVRCDLSEVRLAWTGVEGVGTRRERGADSVDGLRYECLLLRGAL